MGRPTCLRTRLSSVGNQNRLHPGSDSGSNAGFGVFEYDAVRRAMAKARGRHQEHIGLGFALADLVTTDDHLTMAQHAGLKKLIRRKLCCC